MKIYENISDLIGNTPLLHLTKFKSDIGANIFAKLEYFNPQGSIKDRTAYSMLKGALDENKINSDTIIIEPTSGNTGIGLAALCASMGLKIILTMPESMSIERRRLLAAYGAEIILTPAKDGMKGAIDKAFELASLNKNSYIPSQFTNKLNPKIHFETTGPEIWRDTEGKLDVFIAGVGTGGTITGVGHYLKSKNPDIKIVAVEPYSSPVLSGGESGAHKIQGIGAGFVPEILDRDVIDEIIKVKDDDALSTGRLLAQKEGLLVGISSGACVYASYELSKRNVLKNKNIVALLPDTGERYLTSPMFDY